MPELPEVETIRRQLEPRLTGRTLTSVQITDPLLVAPDVPERVTDDLVGRTVTDVGRRGKYLLIGLDDGATLALHLRMTGRLHWRPGAPAPGDERFLRAIVGFDDQSTVTFGDARRFGRMWIIPPGIDQDTYWRGRVGPEPLSDAFTAARLDTILRGRRIAIKSALLDQSRLAGLGNMYVDEVLFAARIHPRRAAGSLSTAETRAVHRAIRDRLRTAIDAGGASIDTYRDGLGQPGRMQHLLRVHLHEGEPCPRCGTIIVKDVVGQRGTYWCPRCQPDPDGSAPPAGAGRRRRIRESARHG